MGVSSSIHAKLDLLAAHVAEVRAEVAEVRAEVAEVKAEVRAEMAEVRAEAIHVNAEIRETQQAIEASQREHGAVFEQFVRATHSGLWGRDCLEGLHLKTVGDVLAYLHIEPTDQGQAEGVYFYEDDVAWSTSLSDCDFD